MTKETKKTIDTSQSDTIDEKESEVKQVRGAFSKVKRQLSDKDLKNPAVGRLLLNQNDKYEQEISTLKDYKEKYHEADKKACVLAERLKGFQRSVTTRSVLLVFGGLLGGFLPSLWVNQKFFWSVAIIAIVLFLIALLKPIQKDAHRDK